MSRLAHTSLIPILLAALTVFASPALGQDAHYWTNQYGTRGNLLGGAVVGSVVDISAVYYNPGAVALIEEPDLVATSKVFEASDVSIRGSGDLDLQLSDLNLGVAPGYFAGLMPFKFLGNHVLGYSFLTRYKFDANLRAAGSGTTDVIGDPTPEDFFVELQATSKLSESWAGLTWSAPLGPRLGLGVTGFVTIRSQKGRATLNGQAFEPAATSGAISLFDEGFTYYHYGVLAKLGATYDWMGVSFGITATTPRLGVLGKGETVLNTVVAGQDLDGDSTNDLLWIGNVQKDLPVTYKSPWSVAGGASYSFGKTSIHGTLEWFDDVPAYDVLASEPFVAQSTGDTLRLEVSQELQSVVNFGVGVERVFTPSFSLSASFRSDNSAIKGDGRTDVSAASWNIYFVTVGSNFTLGGGALALGLAYGFGNESTDEFFGHSGDEILEPLPDDAQLEYRTLRLIIAFAF
jgi:hypothetical protein